MIEMLCTIAGRLFGSWTYLKDPHFGAGEGVDESLVLHRWMKRGTPAGDRRPLLPDWNRRRWSYRPYQGQWCNPADDVRRRPAGLLISLKWRPVDAPETLPTRLSRYKSYASKASLTSSPNLCLSQTPPDSAARHRFGDSPAYLRLPQTISISRHSCARMHDAAMICPSFVPEPAITIWHMRHRCVL
jgi:hypothetical protein